MNTAFVMADGHKWILSPEGLALFYCRSEWRDRLRLTQYGWHMVEDSGNYDTPD
jgi:selenocysteine lyase/cysteine desulfurase